MCARRGGKTGAGDIAGGEGDRDVAMLSMSLSSIGEVGEKSDGMVIVVVAGDGVAFAMGGEGDMPRIENRPVESVRTRLM